VKCLVVVVLGVLSAPSSALVGFPAVFRSQGCRSSTRTLAVFAVERPENPPDINSVNQPLLPVPHRSYNIMRRVVNGIRTAVLIGAAGAFMRVPGSPTALAAKPASPTPTKQIPKKSSSGTSFLTTVAMGGGLVYWSIRSAKEEDEEEQRTIKEEAERQESLAKEYTDIDEGVTADEDLFASLRSRLNTTSSDNDGDNGAGPEQPPPGGGGGGAPPPTPPPVTGGGSSAVLEPPKPEPEEAPPSPAASAEDIERLKRMFGGADSS